MIGRNDPCSCGSGLKYKKCCLSRDDKDKMAYLRVRRARDRFNDKFLKFIASAIPEPDDHIKRFEARVGESLSDLNMHAFIRTLADSRPDGGRTILERFLDEDFDDPLDLEIARGYAKARGGFYRVLFVRSGIDIEAKNIVDGRTYRFTDVSLSTQASVGQVCSLVVYPVEEMWVVESNAINFQGNGARILYELERAARERDLTLEQFAEEIGRDAVEFYILVKSIVDEMMVPPTLTNMDGDHILIAKARYRVNDFRAVERFLKESDAFDVDDSERELFALWLDESDRPLVLGNVRLKRGGLVAEANSKERLERLCSVLEDALGDAIVFKGETIQDIEQLVEEHADRLPSNRRNVQEVDPETLREIAEGFMREFYEKWADEPIPALEGLTPREAIKTPDGRRRVETLLEDMEADSVTGPIPVTPDVDAIRRGLGLPVQRKR